MTKFFLLLLLYLIHPQKEPQLIDNSIGVAYLKDIKENNYDLELVFPISRVKNHYWNGKMKPGSDNIYSFHFKGEIKLFDKKGVLASILLDQLFHVNFWCENDGGIQFRPVTKIRLSKGAVLRGLSASRDDLQNLVCFVVVNGNSAYPFPTVDTIKPRLAGDLDGDGKMEAAILTILDDAENCDLNPPNHQMIFLNANGEKTPLRCCGP